MPRKPKDPTRPCYNLTSPTTRTVVITLPPEKWAWLDMIASDRKESMRFVIASILDLVITEDHAEEMRNAAA